MAKMVTATFRTNPEYKAKIDELAKRTRRSSSFYYNLMLERYLEDIEDLSDAMEVAENIKSGKEATVPLEAVMKEFGL
jgi:RHH-type rel operon transcriptional repressor/antitoxin RelB